MAIDSLKTRAGQAIHHAITRVDVGPQIVARNAGGSLDREHIFGGELFGLIEPAPHPWLRNAEKIGKCLLRTDLGYRSLKGFETREVRHGR